MIHIYSNYLYLSVVFAGTAAFRVSGTIAVSGFTRLWSYRGHPQIVAMEWKELRIKKHVQKIF